MMRWVLLLGLVWVGQLAFAQSDSAPFSSLSLTPRDTLDKAKLCVHYQQAVRENLLDSSKFIFSEMILQVGEHCSNYTNYIQLWSDSIMVYDYKHKKMSAKDGISQAIRRATNCGDLQTIFKNHPQGKYLTQDLVFLDRYQYEEEIPRFDWTLETDTLTCLGYLCRKATCDFRGRRYTAWYAPKIAVSNGPWKFNGLPGLILKVVDSKGDYVFEATELYKVTWGRPIYYLKRDNQMKVTRERFLQAQKRDKENPMAALQNSGKIVGDLKGTNLKKCQFNPIELE